MTIKTANKIVEDKDISNDEFIGRFGRLDITKGDLKKFLKEGKLMESTIKKIKESEWNDIW